MHIVSHIKKMNARGREIVGLRQKCLSARCQDFSENLYAATVEQY